MQIDVAKAVRELLFEKDLVIIPGLGGFRSTTSSSSVDYVKGVVSPPSRKLDFNTNLVINDGILVNHIMEREVVTAQEANEAIEQYVENIKSSLDQREIVDIPDVGRMYKDFENKIRFMPEGTNFDPSAFGLPTVPFQPVIREKTPATAAHAAAPATEKKAAAAATAAASSGDSAWATRLLPWLLGLAAILLVISLAMHLGGEDPQAENLPAERLNVKPSTGEESGGEDTPGTSGDGANEQPGSGSEAPPAGTEDTPPPPPPTPSIEKAFIVIHSFGQKKNADAFSRELRRAGYTPVTKLHNGLNRVGIEQSFPDSTALERTIRELGRKFGASPIAVDY